MSREIGSSDDRADEKKFNNLLAAMRQEYSSPKLPFSDSAVDPFLNFIEWFQDAVNNDVPEPNAMTLCTVGKEGFPSARTVLLKGYENQSFIFYTNLNSRKSRELIINPSAACLFHWPRLHRQIAIEAKVEQVSENQAVEYFNSRPRGSQIGAWVSRQGTVISSRLELDRLFLEINQRFDGKAVTKPPYWGGFRLIPTRFEFWQGRASRLHDRLEFQKKTGKWVSSHLSP